VRLNQYLSKCGISSRRKADELILAKRITVNGVIINSLGEKINPAQDKVTVNGKEIFPKQKIYLLVNKPKGVTCSREDRFAKITINQILPKKFSSLFTIGRLDKDSEGLIILTNDGELCYKITHPKFAIEKEYQVIIDKPFNPEHKAKMLRGIKLENDYLKFKSLTANKTNLKIILSEGKKREIRRLLGYFGYKTIELKRLRIGKLLIGNLASGKYLIISEEIIKKIFK